MKYTRFFSIIFFTAVIIVPVFYSKILNIATDWWFFQEIGLTDVFLKTLQAKLILGSIVASVAALFFIINIYIANSSRHPWISGLLSSVGTNLNINDKITLKIGVFVSVILSLFIGLFTVSGWESTLLYLNQTGFGQNDPLFSKDIGFYVFSLPFFENILFLASSLIFIAFFMVASIYLIKGGLNLSGNLSRYILSSLFGLNFKKPTVENHSPKARIHISVLLALFFLCLAAGTYLSHYNLLVSKNGAVFGAGFTDASINIPFIYASSFLMFLSAIFSLFYGISGKYFPLAFMIALTFIGSLISPLVSSFFQRFIVAPNEFAREKRFIEYNINSTQKAYNLDQVDRKKIAADQFITSDDIKENNLTIKNVRLWDRDPLLSTFSQLQEIRTYYEFASVDNDRYLINNELRQIMLSPRELASESLPNRNFINERLTFTHGYGIAAGPVNQVTPEGLPVLFAKDLPPKSSVKELEIKRPEIYFGEIPNDYIIVNTNTKEFNFPKGDENVFSTYEGTGGVKLDSFIKRLVYSLKFNSMKLFLSGDITEESRIMYFRNILERIQKTTPFISYDNDPYMVVSEGRLYWIFDGYTSTDRYPYSEPMLLNGQRINYVRNSVKAVLDAYNGSVVFYAADSKDPIIRSYSKIFPNLLNDLEKMPKSLRAHIRYPEDIFTIQSTIFTTYHMKDPQIFYNKEDQWEIPSISSSSTAETQQAAQSTFDARHMIMKLPDKEKEEFLLMLPFTPRSKDNLSAWMVAGNDGDSYGKLTVYQFPKDKLVFGPKQIIGRINQDAEVSRQISLWDQRGSQVIQGPLLVIPIEQSLIYVRPLYLKAENGKIPELKRVIVAYDNKIAMEETLEKSLSRIFGQDTTPDTTPDKSPEQEEQPSTPDSETSTDKDLLRDASLTYDEALRAQREGDWTKYGEEIKKLGDILKSLSN